MIVDPRKLLRPFRKSEANGNHRPTDSAGSAVEHLSDRLRNDRFIRVALSFLERCGENMPLMDLVMEQCDDERRCRIQGRTVVNFGSDSFLGLDRDPRVQRAIAEALPEWGTHNGSSRSFSSVQLCEEAERRLATWLGVEDTLIFPSVTLANVGLIPALVGSGDVLVVDRHSHDSIWQGAKIASANGAVLRKFDANHPQRLAEFCERSKKAGCVVAVDGVYSMTGHTPRLVELDSVTRAHGGILYVDDAHGTAVIGPQGRGAAYQTLGTLKNILMVGSLSKAFSCMGAFVTCTKALKLILKMKANSYIFGGPVPPPYLAAVCQVCDILGTPEHDRLMDRIRTLGAKFVAGAGRLGYRTTVGDAPIISVLIGDIEPTLAAGRWMFNHGFYVQPVTYPAVPINGGVLRVQINANHSDEAVDGLLNAFEQLKRAVHCRVT